jgi:K+/H+ antiporter YhaU regulatory subunit KhtT
VALAYNAHRALLDEEGLKKFDDAMIQHCLDDEESKDVSKVLKGGCAKAMDHIGNQLSHQVSMICSSPTYAIDSLFIGKSLGEA